MKSKHEGDYKGFIQLSRAWYGEANLPNKNEKLDEVTFGFYSPEGGTSGEMTMEWIKLDGQFIPKLRVFSDSWSALSNMHDLIDILGEHDEEDTTPEKFCQYLLQCGFIDKTEEKSPYYNNAEEKEEPFEKQLMDAVNEDIEFKKTVKKLLDGYQAYKNK